MANEITISASLAYSDSEGSDEALDIADLMASVASKKYIKHKQNIGTSEEAINLGECTSPGFCLFINRDPTNYIELKCATSGTIFGKVKAGEPALLRLGSGAQAPYAIANTGACQLEFFIINT